MAIQGCGICGSNHPTVDTFTVVHGATECLGYTCPMTGIVDYIHAWDCPSIGVCAG